MEVSWFQRWPGRASATNCSHLATSHGLEVTVTYRWLKGPWPRSWQRPAIITHSRSVLRHTCTGLAATWWRSQAA